VGGEVVVMEIFEFLIMEQVFIIETGILWRILIHRIGIEITQRSRNKTITEPWGEADVGLDAFKGPGRTRYHEVVGSYTPITFDRSPPELKIVIKEREGNFRVHVQSIQ
jgi:hypothetical protein